MEKEQLGLWRALAHKIFSSVFVDHGAVFPVIDILGTSGHLFPPKQQPVWRAVVACLEADTPPTPEAVCGRMNGEADLGYLQTIAAQWSDEDNRRVLYYAREMRRLGMLARVQAIGRRVSEIDDVEKLAEAIAWAEAEFGEVLTWQSNRDGGSCEVIDSAWEMIGNSRGIKTGLEWFDRQGGGLWPGMNYWIAAAYKQGKTTLLRNLLLNLANQGVACDVFSGEGNRELFALDCVAMLATQLLIARGVEHHKLRLSGLFIHRTWQEDRPILTRDEVECIEAAREKWRNLPVRIWDSKDGIKDLALLRQKIRMSKLKYGSVVHFLDYSQLFGSGATLYERQSNTALAVQDIATRENVVLVALAQRNEKSISGGAAEGYSVGVKGGGDASAAADGLFVPCVDPALPTTFRVVLKFSRHTGYAEGTHTINPTSGQIIR